jgi:hypothetical protein
LIGSPAQAADVLTLVPGAMALGFILPEIFLM